MGHALSKALPVEVLSLALEPRMSSRLGNHSQSEWLTFLVVRYKALGNCLSDGCKSRTHVMMARRPHTRKRDGMKQELPLEKEGILLQRRCLKCQAYLSFAVIGLNIKVDTMRGTLFWALCRCLAHAIMQVEA